MDINSILTFIAVAALLVISPGPNGFLIAKTVPLSGPKAGFANIAGFVVAFFIHGTLSIFGISVLLLQSGTAFLIFKLLGAAYLIWIGINALRNAFKRETIPSIEPSADIRVAAPTRGAFLEGLVTNTLNPKVSMFYLAAFPQFLSPGESTLSAYALVTAHSLVNLMWFSMMVLALSRMKKIANNTKFKMWLNSFTGVVFIGFGAKLALSKGS